jgi:hypothetical protein
MIKSTYMLTACLLSGITVARGKWGLAMSPWAQDEPLCWATLRK